MDTAAKTMGETGALPELTVQLRRSGLHSLVRYKRLEVSNFVWPKIQNGVLQLSRGHHEALFEGLDWQKMVTKPVVAPAAAG